LPLATASLSCTRSLPVPLRPAALLVRRPAKTPEPVLEPAR